MAYTSVSQFYECLGSNGHITFQTLVMLVN